MAVTKTWTWDSSNESFTLNAGADSTLTRDTGNGSPTNGSLKHVTSGRNKSSLVAPSHADLTSVTWETLGVTPGDTVSKVQVLDARTYYGLTDTNTVDQYGPATVHIYAAGTTTEVTGSAPYSRSGSASADGSWQSNSGSLQDVNASYQASNTSLDIVIELASDNGNGGSAASSVHFDYLSVELTIPVATNAPAGAGSVAVSAYNASVKVEPNAELATVSVEAEWSAATYVETVLGISGLTAHYTLHEASGQPADSSTNGYDTTGVIGTPTYDQTGLLTGDTDTSILFDNTGTSQLFTIPYTDFSLNNGPWTVVAWVKRVDLTTNTFYWFWGDHVSAGWFLGFRGSDGALELYNNATGAVYISTQTFKDTNVHMVAISKNGATTTMWADGSSLTKATGTDATLSDEAANWAIGSGNPTSGSNGYDGYLEHLSIFNAVVSTTDLDTLYDIGTGVGGGPTGGPSVKVAPNAPTTGVTVVAYDPPFATGTNAPAELATVTVTAYNVTASTTASPDAGLATVAVVAYDATVSTSSPTNAPAELATVAIGAYDASVSVQPNAEAASVGVTSYNAYTSGAALQDLIDATSTSGTLDLTGMTLTESTMSTINKAMTITGGTINMITSTASLLKITASSVVVDGVTINGPYAGGSDGSRSDYHGIWAEGTHASHLTGIVIKNNTVTGFYNSGVWIEHVTSALVHRNTIDTCGYGGVFALCSWSSEISWNDISTIDGESETEEFNAYGIVTTGVGASSYVSQNNVIKDNWITDIPTWHALDTHGGDTETWLRNIVQGARKAMFLTDLASGPHALDQVVQQNLLLDPEPLTGDVDPVTLYQVDGITFTDNIYVGWGSVSGPPTDANPYYDYLGLSTGISSSGNRVVSNNGAGTSVLEYAGQGSPRVGPPDVGVTAYDATVSTVSATNADAGLATASVSAATPSVALDVPAGAGSVTIAAYDATVSTEVATNADAGLATVAVSATNPTISTTASPDAGLATLGVTAYNPTVQTSGATNAPAGLAAVSVSASAPGTALDVPVGTASVAIGAYDATVSTSTSTNADAGLASVAIAASDATVTADGNAAAGLATVAIGAYNATISTSSNTYANAGLATVGLAASDAGLALMPNAQLAAVSVSASGGSTGLGVNAALASVAVNAYSVYAGSESNVFVNAGLATVGFAATDAIRAGSHGVPPRGMVHAPPHRGQAASPVPAGIGRRPVPRE